MSSVCGLWLPVERRPPPRSPATRTQRARVQTAEKALAGPVKPMFAAPLSYLPDNTPKWPRPATPPPERQCLVCGEATLRSDVPYCFNHFRHADSMEEKLAQKHAQLAKLEALPEAEQPKAVIVSLTNAIPQLEADLEKKGQIATGEAGPSGAPDEPPEAATEPFCPGSGSFSGSERAPSEAGPEAAEDSEEETPGAPSGHSAGYPEPEAAVRAV